MVFEVLVLLFLGFIAGLSGAVIPGPLLAFTVFDTSKKRKITGHTIILGHAIWESMIIIIILVGFGGLIANNELIIYLAGGIALAFMGISMVEPRVGRGRWKILESAPR